MLKKMFILLACLLAFLPALTACTISRADLMAGVEAAAWPEKPGEPEAAFQESVSQFGWQLMQKSLSDQGNILISPASVYLALAMTLNGAAGESRSAMLKTLFAQDLSLAELNQGCRDWITLLNKIDKDSQLAVANSIWLDQNFAVDPGFLQSNADYFAASAKALDFSQSAAKHEINHWVKQNTGGKIEKIIDEINPDSVMFLINAVYFKSDWQLPFEPDLTRPGLFTTATGQKEVQYMNQVANLAYAQGQDCQAIILPYSSDRFAFLAILPDEDISARDWINANSALDLRKLLEQDDLRSIELSLPKFISQYDKSLKDMLAGLGMAVTFEPDQADFSLINKTRVKNLFISDVKHKTYCAVDEKGTEAAAVTSVEIRATSMPQSNLSLQFDRPFIYAIMDVKTELPLFLGLLEDPTLS